MALAQFDVIQVSIRSTLFDQRILNILHYIVNVAHTGSTGDQLKDIATSIANDTGSQPIISTLIALFSPELLIDDVRAQRVYPARTIYYQTDVSQAGTNIAGCKTSNVAMSLTKRSETPGRKGIGRIQLAGIGDGYMVAGKWDLGGIGAEVLAVRNALVGSYTTAATPITLVPVIFNPTGAPDHYSVVTNVDFEDTVRTMHRRTVRLGE